MGCVREYYKKRRSQHGQTVQALGWGSRESQHSRFQVLCEVDDLDGKEVLDFGCGHGDLYAYLAEWFPRACYSGCDLDCAIAREKYPEARFFESPVESDIILASGTFNLRSPDEKFSDWRAGIPMLWEVCRMALAANFTSMLTTGPKDPEISYEDPFKVAAFVSRLTKRFVLRHDYRSNDFTIYAYKGGLA